MSSRNLSTAQSLDLHLVSFNLLRLSGTMCFPLLAKLWKNLTFLLFTDERSDWSLGQEECLPFLMRLAASTTAELSGPTKVVNSDSDIQCLQLSMARTVPTPSFSQGNHCSMYSLSFVLQNVTGKVLPFLWVYSTQPVQGGTDIVSGRRRSCSLGAGRYVLLIFWR